MKKKDVAPIVEITKDTGFLYKEPALTDFKAGGETGIESIAYNRSKNWADYLPSPELQKGKFIDTMACVTYSALNSIEAQFQIQKDRMEVDDIKWLSDNGYIVNGELSLSDRFTAKMSGTTKDGNYVAKVWDSIRNDGMLPESDWPSDPASFTWDEYYKEIPQKLKDKALKFKEILDVKYEWVDVNKKNKKLVFADLLKTAPVQIVVKVSKNWSKDKIVEPSETGFNHAVLLYHVTDTMKVYDHYVKFNKQLTVDYPILCAMRGVLTPKEREVEYQIKGHFVSDLRYGERNDDIAKLQKCLIEMGYMKKSLKPTGYYGDITADAVYRFQVEHNVSDKVELNRLQGKIVGVKTRARLNMLFK